jgi:conjugative relaxase-like TrwC/TraI family protein
VLSVAKIAIGRERYYLATAASDPGARGLVEPDGVWLGRGAESLGLAGVVEERALATVIRGVDPSTGEVLSESHRSGRVRVGALDLTFAPPKSVSLLHALGSAEAVAEVRAGHDGAVAEVLGYLEREAALVRRSLGGSRSVLVADGLVAAGFVHRTSRAPDPHLHTHVLVVNCARGGDGRWTALDGRAVYLHARTAGALYQSHLRFELANRLGVTFGPPGRTAADIEGFDAGLLRAFSRRSLEIRARLEELGLAGPRAKRVVAAATRPEKDLAVPYHELVAGWRETAAELGLSSRRLERIAAGGHERRERRARDVGGLPADSGRAAGRSWLDAALDPAGGSLARPGHESAAAATDVTRRELLRARAQLERDGTEVLAAEAAVDSALAGDRFVERGELSPRLRGAGGRAIPAGLAERRFAAAEVVAAERDIVDVARRAELRSAAPAGEASVADAIARRRTALGPAGAAAASGLARSAAAVMVLSARPRLEHLATDVVDAAVEAWQRSGREVVAVAPAHRTALRLESELGLPATVLAPDGRDAGRDVGGFEAPAGGVVIVAAAERVDARALRQALTEAETAGATALVWTSLPLGGDRADRTGVLMALAAAGGGPTAIDAGAETSVRSGRRPGFEDEPVSVASSRRRLGNVEVVLAATAADARALALVDRDLAQRQGRTAALVVPWRVRAPAPGEGSGVGREVSAVGPAATAGLLREDRATRLLVIGEAAMLPDAAVAAGVVRTHYVPERALAGAGAKGDAEGRVAEITEPPLVTSVLGRRPSDALVRRAWRDAAQALVAHDLELQMIAAGEVPASVARAEETAHEATMRSLVAELRLLSRQRAVDEPRLAPPAGTSLSGNVGGREDRSLRPRLGRELSR